MNSLEVNLAWKPVHRDADGNGYCYPMPISKHLKDNYSHPCIYRWLVLSPDREIEGVYIGEAEKLAQRIQRVRTPGREGTKGGETNKRLKQLFIEPMEQGRSVSLEIADIEEFSVNGVTFTCQSLHNRFHRCMLENLVLSIEQGFKRELLNKYVDVTEKLDRKVGDLLENLPPEKRSAVLDDFIKLVRDERLRRQK